MPPSASRCMLVEQRIPYLWERLEAEKALIYRQPNGVRDLHSKDLGLIASQADIITATLVTPGGTIAATHSGISSYLCNLRLSLGLCGCPDQGLNILSPLHTPASIPSPQAI